MKFFKKLKSIKGYSMSEALIVVLIIALISAGMVSGVSLASNHFEESLAKSDSKELYSTLMTIISNELRYTKTVEYDEDAGYDEEGYYKVDYIFSQTYALESGLTELCPVEINAGTLKRAESVEGEPNGYLAFGRDVSLGGDDRFVGKLLLSDKSYPYRMKARASIKFHPADPDDALMKKGCFKVNLTIVDSGGHDIISNSFDVIPVNSPRKQDG